MTRVILEIRDLIVCTFGVLGFLEILGTLSIGPF